MTEKGDDVPALSTTSEFRESGGIREAGLTDRESICATLSAAFTDGPVAEWLLPDRHSRTVVYLAYGRIVYDQAATGRIFTTGDRRGAAVWFRHGLDGSTKGTAGHVEESTMDAVDEDLAGMAGAVDLAALLAGAVSPEFAGAAREAARRFIRLDRAFTAHQPSGGYEHLAFLGVHPSFQGRGIGGRLLAHHHRRLDAVGVSAFLVATSRRSRDLYGRHGYRVLERFTVPEDQDAGTGPELWSMWREPLPDKDTRSSGRDRQSSIEMPEPTERQGRV
jgi:ribosomal protein S18 acetylase RimI-like enzyme